MKNIFRNFWFIRQNYPRNLPYQNSSFLNYKNYKIVNLLNKKNILNCLINSTGNVLLGGEGIEIRNLSKTVRQKLIENDKLIISVKAHPATSYSDYIAVIDQLKRANATRISIAESN